MADEKQTTSDLDDWLEDLDDADEFSGELDQENIDALLSGVESGASEPETGKAEAPPADNASVDLDQANIDALLGGNLEVGEQKAAAPAEAADNTSVELDQANIDALLGGSGEDDDDGEAKSAEALGDNAPVELDQANIDALLGGLEERPGQQTAAPGQQEETGSGELDQANIDLLLGADDDDSPQAGDSGELDQDNIDALLRGADKEEKELAASDFLAAGPAGEVGRGQGLDVDQDEIDQLFSGLDDDEAEEPFPAEEMDLADVLEGDDDFQEVGDTAKSNKTSSGEVTVAGDIDNMNHEKPAKDQGTGGVLPFLPASINKTVATVIAVCLALVVASGVYFLRSGPKKEPAIPMQSAEPVAKVEEPQPQAAVNHVPVVGDSLFTMPETGGEVAVPLSAKDDDGDTVTYEVATPPQHGRLSGEAPALVYLPNNDFPGEDRFEYKASDGKESSALAKVVITGPNLAKLAVEKEKQRAEAAKKSFKAARAKVFAKNKTFDTASTAKVIIDWARIWREANHSPYSAKVSVEVDDSRLKGSLSKVDGGRYVYRPDPAFSGKDVLHYRFKKGGLSSGLGKVTMLVRRGDLAPEIRLGEMAGTYMVGETVRIDASPTRDEARSTLSFRWEQISGVPVQIKKNNEQGSIITFAMPSSFYTSTEPGPVLRVTAVDAAGQSDSKDVKVRTTSRRKSALWGMAGNAESDAVGLR
ncbi:MAG: Ig-like domain-containing protein [Desulfobulbaceae bacterium]|nr:Ig-like domain-containing protein [Desulfobulbaceae bacterium]